MEITKIKRLQMNFSILLTVVVLLIGTSAMATTELNTSLQHFASNIFQKIAAGKSENIIFSPASIHACLGLVLFGAAGKTASEMRQVLKLENASPNVIAQNYEQFMKQSFKKTNNDDEVQLSMANRIYVNNNLSLKSQFNEIAQKSLQAEAETMNFADSGSAIKKINNFVEEQTQHKIKNLLQPGAVNAETSLVLINAIYFKGKWEIPFSAGDTHKADFAAFGKNRVQVDTMVMDEYIKYGESVELDAKIIELSYKNSDLSMLVILPNAINGLESMEKKLSGKNLNDISSTLQQQKVTVFLPKFRIEYDIDLIPPLKELGLKDMFSDSANFSELLENERNQRVSDVQHKAFIDVNEAGSEAAAATFMKIVPMSMPLDPKVFRADHPFMFAIKDSTAIYFAGHVVKF